MTSAGRKLNKKAKKSSRRRAKAKRRRTRRRLKAEKKKRERIPLQKKYDIVQQVLRNVVATIKDYPYRPALIGKWIAKKDDIKYALDIKPKAMNIIKRTINEEVREPAEEPVADRLEQLRAEVAEVKELLTSKENMEKIIDKMDELRIDCI
jgi:hypothetical protein